MSLSPVIGTEVPEAANGVATPVSLEPHSENGPHTPATMKCGGSRVPCPGEGSEDESLGETENHMHVERSVFDEEGSDTETDQTFTTSSLDSQTHIKSLHSPRAHDPSLPTATGTGDSESDLQLPEASHTGEPPGAALPEASHTARPPGAALPEASHTGEPPGAALPEASHTARPPGAALPEASHTARPPGAALPEASHTARPPGAALPEASHTGEPPGAALPEASHTGEPPGAALPEASHTGEPPGAALPEASHTGEPPGAALPEASHTGEPPGAAPPGDSTQHTNSKDSCERGSAAGADRQQTETETVEVGSREAEEDGEREKQDEEEDEKKEKERRRQHTGRSTHVEPSRHYSSSAPGPSTSSSFYPPPPPLPSDSSPCPPHVMAQVRVRNVPERDRIVRGMQDSKSLDEISQACGGGSGARGGGRGGQSEGRRATISSALELEGTVSHDGDLTHFITKNLEQKIKMSSKPSLDCSDSDCSGPIHRSRASSRRPADIPPIDPAVLLDLQRHTQEVAHSVEMMMHSLNGTIQNMTALSVGYIQTYRDSVDSLGESVDMSIKGMYTLMARCEELDRSMQPIHTLAAQIRDIKRTLDALEAICK